MGKMSCWYLSFIKTFPSKANSTNEMTFSVFDLCSKNQEKEKK